MHRQFPSIVSDKDNHQESSLDSKSKNNWINKAPHNDFLSSVFPSANSLMGFIRSTSSVFGEFPVVQLNHDHDHNIARTKICKLTICDIAPDFNTATCAFLWRSEAKESVTSPNLELRQKSTLRQKQTKN